MSDAPRAGAAGAGSVSDEVARLEHAVKRYRGVDGVFAAVDDVTFSVRRGARVGVIGESGSGKSTTARLLLGLALPDEGRVTVLGEEWASLDRRERTRQRARIGAVFQEPIESLDPTMSVINIIAEPLVVHRRHLSRSEFADRVEVAIARVGLSSALLYRRPAQLSGGQAQRVSIARALINEPSLLILDEPTSALDVSVQAQILDLLDEIAAGMELSWVFITHDLHVARSVCDEVIVMRRGKVVEQGPCDVVLEAPREDYTRELLASALLD